MLLVFERFGFRALWSPYFLGAMVCITILYFMAIKTWRSKFKGNNHVSAGKISFFVIGMVLLYLVEGGPVDLFSHLMFTAHMVQMAILYLLVPPLLLLGTPDWLMEYLINKPVINQLVKLFSKPLMALLLFNGVFSVYHVPIVFDFVKSDVSAHAIYTSFLFFFAVMMWWPIFTPIKELHTLSSLKKIGYMFANGMIITPACALIMFSFTPMYATYSDPKTWINALQLCVPASEISSLGLIGPEMFNLLPTLDDQQFGGILMKVLQEIIYGSVLGYIFIQWMKKERNQDEVELSQILSSQPVE